MGRPQEAGLEYFGLPTNLFEIDELHFVIAKHGIAARGVISSLLMRLFEVGYCFRWGERDRTIFASKIGTPLELVETIVSDAINEGFFCANLFKKHQILSSKWIQELYHAATSKRKSVKYKREFLLIEVKNPNAVVSASETLVSGDIEEQKPSGPPEETTQSRVEYSKVDQSIDLPPPPREKKPIQTLIVPQWVLDNPRSSNAILSWIQHRKEKKNKLTQSTLELQLKKYNTPELLVSAIEHSILNGWVGLFPPDDKGGGGQVVPRKLQEHRAKQDLILNS